MKLMLAVSAALFAALFTAGAAHAADPPTIASLYENQLRTPENEVVSLAEAMPDAKYNFAPTAGQFTGVRMFIEQVKHIATTNYMACSAVLQQKMPVDAGKNENGSDTIKTKAQAVQYLKDSFAYCHKAMQSLTPANQLEMVPSPFGQGQMAPPSSVAAWRRPEQTSTDRPFGSGSRGGAPALA